MQFLPFFGRFWTLCGHFRTICQFETIFGHFEAIYLKFDGHFGTISCHFRPLWMQKNFGLDRSTLAGYFKVQICKKKSKKELSFSGDSDLKRPNKDTSH